MVAVVDTPPAARRKWSGGRDDRQESSSDYGGRWRRYGARWSPPRPLCWRCWWYGPVRRVCATRRSASAMTRCYKSGAIAGSCHKNRRYTIARRAVKCIKCMQQILLLSLWVPWISYEQILWRKPPAGPAVWKRYYTTENSGSGKLFRAIFPRRGKQVLFYFPLAACFFSSPYTIYFRNCRLNTFNPVRSVFSCNWACRNA